MKKVLLLLLFSTLLMPVQAQDRDINIGARAINEPTPILSDDIWNRLGRDYFSIDVDVTDLELDAATAISEFDDTATGCAGMIGREATYRIQWERAELSEELPMQFFVASRQDTTLAIREPDGEWLCQDDYQTSQRPLITIESLRAGDYSIWIGAKDTTSDFRTRLYISKGNYTPDFPPEPCCDNLSFSNPAQGNTEATITYYEVDEWLDDDDEVAGIQVSTDIIFRGEGGTTFIIEAIAYDADTDTELTLPAIENDVRFCEDSPYPCDIERIRRDASRRDYSRSSRGGPVIFNIPELDLSGLGEDYYIVVTISSIDRDDTVETGIDVVTIEKSN